MRKRLPPDFFLNVHEVPGFDVPKGLGKQGLAVSSCLPLRSAVVEDDRTSILRWIKVAEQVSISCRRPKQKRSSQLPLTFFILLTGEHLEDSGGIMKERNEAPELWTRRAI